MDMELIIIIINLRHETLLSRLVQTIVFKILKYRKKH